MNRRVFAQSGRRQGPRPRGATMLVALVFLLIFAVIAASALSGSMTSARAIGNMQWRNEAINAANDAIDRLLNNVEFAERASTLTQQVNATPMTVDANGDGNADVKVTFPQVTIGGTTSAGPRCLRARPVPDTSLDPNNAQDVVCMASGDPNATGIARTDASGAVTSTPPTGNCSNTEWSITVQADDDVTNTHVTVTQGVGVRVMREFAQKYCQ